MSGEFHDTYRLHPRQYERFKFVYPVVSRRSKGISAGVNLNPDKVCNFSCIYCQVDRTTESETHFVEMDRLLEEIDAMLSWITSDQIFSDPRFASVPGRLRRLNDIAFAGDGEPTTYRNFDEIISQVAEIKRRHELDDVKMVLITNSSMLHRENVRRGLEVLDQNQGEIWAKLDAGTEEYFSQINRPTVPYQRILDNITLTAQQRPIVIQSLFMHVNGEPPTDTEISAYIGRLNSILRSGGQLKLVQVYTVARKPAEDFVTALSDEEVDRITQRVIAETGIAAESFYS